MTDYICRKCGYRHESIGRVHAHMWKHIPIWKAIYINFLPKQPVKTFKEWTEEAETSGK